MFLDHDLAGTRRMKPALLGVLMWATIAAGPAFAADGDDEKKDGWTGEASASVTAQSGSVDTFAGAITAGAQRKWTKDTLGVRFAGFYGTTRDRRGLRSKNDTIQNSQGLFGDWKHIIEKGFFWVSTAELSRDTTQDREVRARVNTGPGYRTWQGAKADVEHFDLNAGFGYRYELYDGNVDLDPALRVDGSDQHLAEAIAGFEYKNDLFDGRVMWTHTGSVALPVNRTEAYIVTTEIIASVPLSDAWSFRTGAFYEYVNDVPDDLNPSTFRVTLGLGYSF